ncbi:MAG TPA: DegV family protein [Candidatus Aquicultor sp.]|jgi:DegV family protein with EDD domain
MARIALVTDSTADMPLSFYEENDVTMVPLIVRFGDNAFKDWVELPPSKFYEMLRASNELPKTSTPPVQDFIEAYEKYSGYDHIISIHLSSKLSGTYQSASIAAQNSPVAVTVIDGKSGSIGTAMLLNELIDARNQGKSLDEMVTDVEALIERVKVAFCVDTLKYLEMGGRIGKAAALVGSLLNIKPILTLDDGIVAPLKKVKGQKRMIREVIELVKEESSRGKVKLALVHADAEETLNELAEGICQEGINHEVVFRSEIGSVIGTYTGPGTMAAMFYAVEP